MKKSLNILIYGCLLGIVSSQYDNASENLAVDEPTPIVIWHGMGDNCCHSFSMGRIKEMLEKHIKGKRPQSMYCHTFFTMEIMSFTSLESYINHILLFEGVYVRSLMVGNSPNEDTLNGFFMPVKKQIELVCKTIKEDPKLQNGFNGMGFSQGGQFMRAIAEICPHGMKKLISFGGQHQGIYGNFHLQILMKKGIEIT